MKTLELKDICGYMPYGLMQKHYKNVCPFAVEIQSHIGGYVFLKIPFRHGKPLLRPMSDITKEIIHEGERFVPIVELAHIIEPGDNWQVYRDGAGDIVEYEDDDEKCIAHLRYSSDCFELNVGDDTETITMPETIAFFDKLNEWMFDYRGLISAGLAIDVNTLPENPYE